MDLERRVLKWLGYLGLKGQSLDVHPEHTWFLGLIIHWCVSVLIYIYSSQPVQLSVQPIGSHVEKDYSVFPLINASTLRKIRLRKKSHSNDIEVFFPSKPWLGTHSSRRCKLPPTFLHQGPSDGAWAKLSLDYLVMCPPAIGQSVLRWKTAKRIVWWPLALFSFCFW